MFVVYCNGCGEESMLNLDAVDIITVRSEPQFGQFKYRVVAWQPHENEDFTTLVDDCGTSEVARRHIANIADAMALGKNVYVIGTDPKTDNAPSKYFAIERGEE